MSFHLPKTKQYNPWIHLSRHRKTAKAHNRLKRLVSLYTVNSKNYCVFINNNILIISSVSWGVIRCICCVGNGRILVCWYKVSLTLLSDACVLSGKPPSQQSPSPFFTALVQLHCIAHCAPGTGFSHPSVHCCKGDVTQHKRKHLAPARWTNAVSAHPNSKITSVVLQL